MLIYSTKIPVSDSFDKDQFIEIVLKWNEGSKYDRFVNASWDRNSYNLSFDDGDKKLEIDDFVEKGIIASRLQKEDENGIWTTEFILNYSERTIVICLTREITESTISFLTNYYPPYFVKMIVWNEYAGLDKDLTVQNSAIDYSMENCNDLVRIFKKESKYCLPVIFVTQNGDGTYPLNVDDLAFRLQAVAHVIKEADGLLGKSVNDEFSKKTIKPGRVYLFYPNHYAKERTFNIKGNCDNEYLADRIIASVYNYMNSQLRGLLDSWNGIQNAKLQLRNNKLFTEHKNVKDENQTLYDTFDEQLKENEVCINNLNREILMLRQENQGLRNKLANMQTLPLIFYGEESDFYEGEIREIVMEVLREYVKNYQENSRREHIITDLLENNTFSMVPEERKEKVKRILKGYTNMSNTMKRDLEDMGFSVSGDGKHYKLTYFEDQRYVATMAKTCSDARAGNNLASVISKKMF